MSVTTRDAAREPVNCGEKVTEIVQFAPAATEFPQVLVCAKSFWLIPEIVMLVRFSVPVPVLVRVTAEGALVLRTSVLGNTRMAGERLTVAAVPPVPDRNTD